MSGASSDLPARSDARPPLPAQAFIATLYGTLCEVARREIARTKPGTALEPSELVHECYLKLSRSEELGCVSRSEFLGLAATMLRQVLVDYIRSRNAAKRGRDWRQIGIEPKDLELPAEVDLVELDDCLDKLAVLDERQAKVVELRYFGGLTIPQTAKVLGISPRTVTEDWTMARAWLKRALDEGADSERGG